MRGAGSGRQSVCVRPSTSASPSPTTVCGSTRSTRRPHVISGSASTFSETDPAVIKVLLKVTDKGDYAWTECNSCGAGWQVPYYTESVG